ncbi:hypothetical protein TWF970_002048 [Orbilia oligospora]|uniref:Uncharacterized protein n=1 Tax=Orbilia oligospora TaxID=2813651 RepID=A0A7C8VPT7_ORBOL|nr:hypothetical protein TWF970_002048 [Orbilia oligospora]
MIQIAGMSGDAQSDVNKQEGHFVCDGPSKHLIGFSKDPVGNRPSSGRQFDSFSLRYENASHYLECSKAPNDTCRYFGTAA